MDAPVVEKQSSGISIGTIINISEQGIRYRRNIALLTATKGITAKKNSNDNQLQPLNVRTILFSLPENNKNMRLLCTVVAEQVNESNNETSCVFLGLSGNEKKKLQEYVQNNAL